MAKPQSRDERLKAAHAAAFAKALAEGKECEAFQELREFVKFIDALPKTGDRAGLKAWERRGYVQNLFAAVDRFIDGLHVSARLAESALDLAIAHEEQVALEAVRAAEAKAAEEARLDAEARKVGGLLARFRRLGKGAA